MQLPGINTEKLIECLQEANNAIARMAENIRPAIANIKVARINIPSESITSIQSVGVKGISVGYRVKIDNTPGIYDGQEYDAIQLDMTPPREIILRTESRCKFFARSPYLKCAVNPTGDCASCQHFEKE